MEENKEAKMLEVLENLQKLTIEEISSVLSYINILICNRKQ